MSLDKKRWMKQQVVLTVRNWLVMTNYAEHNNWPSEMFLDRAMYGAYYYMGVGLAGQDVPETFNGKAEKMYGFSASNLRDWGFFFSRRSDATVVDIAVDLCAWIATAMLGASGTDGPFITSWYDAVLDNFGPVNGSASRGAGMDHFFDEWGRTEWAGMARGDDLLDEIPLGVLYR